MPKKTIRDITIKKRTPVKKVASTSDQAPVSKKVLPKKRRASAQPTGFTHSYKEHNRSSGGGWFWVLLFVVIGVLVAWTFLGGAHIEIVPETESVQGDVAVTAYKQGVDDQFEYEIITLDDTLSQEVSAGDAEFVEEKAQGTIVVYNEESSAQRLIEETRFETPEGLIYKLAKGKAITVPAASGGTPGSLEVTVYADEPGEEYNIDLTDFVIPGWREVGSTKFKTQYARSKTAMTGGFSGTKRIVDEADKAEAHTALRTALTERLRKEAPAQIPPSFVFFDQLSNVTFTSLPNDESTGQKVTLREEGQLYGVLFNRADLSELLAKELVEGYAGEPILVTNFEDLTVTLSTPMQVSESDVSITFSLKGEVAFEWQIDTESISNSVRGILKKEVNNALASFTGIKRANMKMSPTWLRKIPEKVKVEVLEPVL